MTLGRDQPPPAGRALLLVLLWLPLFFLLALLPRLSPVAAGTAFADDLEHTPQYHLQSHRFLNYGELSLWKSVFGERYLIGSAPKIIACIYSALLCLVLRMALLRFGASAAAATAAAILAPLHPIWNTFILWNATGVYLLSLVLMIAGYLLLMRERSAAGIILIAIAISGYQVHVGLLPALIFAERSAVAIRSAVALRSTVAVRSAGILPAAPPPSRRRILQCGAATALYLLATKLIPIETWGGRGLGGSMRNQLQPMLDNLATLTQPLLSFYLGVEASWRFWLVPFALVGLILLIRTRRVLPALAPLFAAAVILPLNVSPTGPRVAAPIWLAMLIAMTPLFERKWLPILLAAIALPVSVAEASNWTRAWRADVQTVRDVRRFWEQRGIDPSQVTIVLAREPLLRESPREWRGRPIVLQNFRPVTPWTYSNVRCCPRPLFRAFGMPRVAWEDEVVHGKIAISARSPFAQWGHDVARRQTLLTVYAPRE